MSQRDTFELVFLLILFSILGWWYFVQLRYLIRLYRSRSWPTADARIQKGAIGGISFGKGASAPASFMGYAYVIQGKRYAGFFALYGDEVHVQDVQDSLPGTPLQIRYNPSDPNISCLLDFNDVRFAGLTATQNPEWLDQAPAFDLQDAIRGAPVSKKF
jgi:hypothetical protein